MLQSSLRGDIAVETMIPADTWRTKVDLSEFELALLNLAVNARDAMTAGGTLTLSTRNMSFARANALDLAGDFVAVEVKDTGVGIEPQLLNRVFEPFFTTKEVGKGTGLGLSQVYGFAKQAGGVATVSSQPGQGTRVTLYLPRTLEPAQEDGAVSAPAATPKEVRARVLMVEDNPEVAKVTRSYLEQFGYAVRAASDVTSARAELHAHAKDIDVVLSDIVMPGGANGLDLALWIRDEFGASLPVVLATGYSDRAQAAADAGFVLLRKPYDAAGVHAALSDVLQKARNA